MKDPVMHTKRPLALALGAALLVPALSACGYSTTQIYTPAAGVNDRNGVIDVLNAAIVSTDGGRGRFIATLSNGSATDSATLDSVAGAGDFGGTLSVQDIEPLEIPVAGLVNLATLESPGGVGIPVAGPFGVGDFVDVTLSFGDGRSADISVPVLPNADAYAGIDGEETTDTERPEPGHSFLLHGEEPPAPPEEEGVTGGVNGEGSR